MIGNRRHVFTPFFEGLQFSVGIEQLCRHVVLHAVYLEGREYGIAASQCLVEIESRVRMGRLAVSVHHCTVEFGPYLFEHFPVDLSPGVELLFVDVVEHTHHHLRKIENDRWFRRRISVQFSTTILKPPDRCRGRCRKNRACGSKYSRTYGSAEVFLRFL